jgi:hypothetical protein
LPHVISSKVSFRQQTVVCRAKPPEVVARIGATERKRFFVMQL